MDGGRDEQGEGAGGREWGHRCIHAETQMKQTDTGTGIDTEADTTHTDTDTTDAETKTETDTCIGEYVGTGSHCSRALRDSSGISVLA